MKQWMKKIVAVVATAAMVCSVGMPVFAAENRPELIVVQANNEISLFAWYHSLPRLWNSNGTVNNSVETTTFWPVTSIYVVSNCDATYTVALEQQDAYGWGPVATSSKLPANVTNEVGFSDRNVDKSKKCLVRLKKTLPGVNSEYSLTVYNAS